MVEKGGGFFIMYDFDRTTEGWIRPHAGPGLFPLVNDVDRSSGNYCKMLKLQ